MPKYPKRTQAAFFQLKNGAGFFKSFSKRIGKDIKGKCFGDCKFIQSPRHLVLHCKHYSKERKIMEKQLKSRMTLTKLFCTEKGKEVLFQYYIIHRSQQL
ncbi:hypothetical protein M501DRAFT_221503 [Patellaria atrata CBS 101060]|uniref:Uncharacterized protein n=1 Tax=Patellaria atrata CBS 101060 TaxID=1346257 RepID=A0A9P4S7V8_9PEZI|nr:hypothetical protein M501DRAFT_221503 [Patellaria atrata CBS 101060]